MHFTWSARKPGLLGALVGLSLLGILPASGQFQRGTIVGTLTDESGDYTFALLLPGSYNVSAEAPGFKTQVVNDIRLEVNQTARIDLKLSVGEIVQRVEAKASLQLLQTDTSELGAVIQNKQIVDLPLNGRDYLQLA